MRNSLRIPITLALVFTLGGHAEIKPLCGRSHVYAVELLSKEMRVYDRDEEAVGTIPEYVDGKEAARLLETGDYVRITAPGIQGRDYLYPAMQMGASNSDGRFGTGLCWWHSRFHRAAVYLMDFAPHRPKPDSETARSLMRRISFLKPATIPGYRSLFEFTEDFPNELNTVLSEWEFRTSLFAPNYAIDGWMVKNLTSAAEKKRIFTESAQGIIDSLSSVPRPIFLMLEEPGAIHGILALSTRTEDSTNTKKVMLRYVDSNEPGGSSEVTFMENGEFASDSDEYGYLQAFDSDFVRIQDGLRTRCGAKYLIPRK